MTHDSHKILEWDLGMEVKPAVSSLSHIQDSPKNRVFSAQPGRKLYCFAKNKLHASQKEASLNL